MSRPRKREIDWWVLFPYKGLNITDDTPGLDLPLFGDSTVISRCQFDTVMSRLPTSGSKRKRQQSVHDMKTLVNYMDSVEQFHSFIAIKRKGQLGDSRSRKRWSRQQNLLELAHRRAIEISSLLSLVLLSSSKAGETCGLTELQLSRPDCTMMLELDNGSWAFQQGGGGGGYTICSPERIIGLSRQQIINLLQQSHFSPLGNIVGFQKCPLSKSLRSAIVQGTITLGSSIHAIDDSSRLLGAVTTIEILVAQGDEKYDTILRRLGDLLGDSALQAYDAKAVFNARHMYVHRGEIVTDRKIAFKAVQLALASLLVYSQACVTFRDKPSLVDYLDLLHASRRPSAHWSPDESVAFRKLVRHRQEVPKLPFLRVRIRKTK